MGVPGRNACTAARIIGRSFAGTEWHRTTTSNLSTCKLLIASSVVSQRTTLYPALSISAVRLESNASSIPTCSTEPGIRKLPLFRALAERRCCHVAPGIPGAKTIDQTLLHLAQAQSDTAAISDQLIALRR